MDDHPVVAEALSVLVGQQRDLRVAGIASSVDDALELTRREKPDAVIVDVSLGPKTGLALVHMIHKHNDRIRCLMFSRYDEDLFGERALRAGARGYVNKNRPLPELLRAIRNVLRGDLVFSEALKTRCLCPTSRRRSKSEPTESLSDREFEVFRLIGMGEGTRQIAEMLHVTISTVETHRRNIRRKLDLSTGRELTFHAVRRFEEQSTFTPPDSRRVAS